MIEIASLYSDCQVTAVDLSFASLAYAQRKTNELEIDNINYLQADILNLQLLDGDFDVIKCEGVLHHMDNPMAGWKVLTDLLKPGGLMTIGLYSEFARTDIVKVREKITSSKVGSSEAEIKKFRELITNSKDYQKLHFAQDFFSLSEFRDLIFHVQEHRFTLLQVKNYLNKLGLKFCGFKDKDIVSKFRKFHGMESDIYDLALWHQFEESNTFTFRGMYQFWCQKS